MFEDKRVNALYICFHEPDDETAEFNYLKTAQQAFFHCDFFCMLIIR